MRLCLLLMFFFALYAEDKPACPPLIKCPEEKSVVTHHQIGDLEYEATAGTIVLRNPKGEAEAELFYVAYTKTGGDVSRPITFCFNGGPGSSSVWLHLGVFGPQIVAMDEKGAPLLPPRLIDNPSTLLQQTDLVFIDPVSTGFSRAAPGIEEKRFHTVEEDIKSIGEMIRLFVTRNGRWDSPKYLAGESYGTTRAAGLAEHLWRENFLRVDGILLVSTVLDFQTIRFTAGNDLPFLTFLPTYAATAHYHGKVKGELDDILLQAERFTENAYLRALFQGRLLSEEERLSIAKQLSSFTSIDTALFLKSDLRLDWGLFCKELLGDQIISRFDGRFTGYDRDQNASYVTHDPLLDLICPVYTQLINSYLSKELNWKEDREYEVLKSLNWEYDSAQNQYLNMNVKLEELLVRAPSVRIFVGSGLYDLATPYFAVEYTFNHLFIPEKLAGNLMLRTYPAGHMFYLHKPSFEEFYKDLKKFYEPSAL